MSLNFGQGDNALLTSDRSQLTAPPLPRIRPGEFSRKSKRFPFPDSQNNSASNNALNTFVAFQTVGGQQTKSAASRQLSNNNNNLHNQFRRQQSSDCENDSPNSENDYDSGTGSSLSLYVALYDFQPEDENQLSLTDGEVISITAKNRNGDWCEAISKNGEIGWVPYNYIAPISLSKHHWYHGRISRESAEYLLSSGINGCFLIRESQTRPGSKSVSIRYEGRVFHYRIIEEAGKFYITSGLTFSTLPKLVHHYSMRANGLVTTLLYPAPRQVDPNAILNNSSDDVDIWEVNRSEIVMHQQIGVGQWGVVNEATWKKHNLRVAIKSLREEMMHLEREFLIEAELMKNMRHPNLVQLLGVCTREAPIYIITEFMTKGNLQDYLRNCDQEQINGFVLMYMATQVCSAMSYLEARDYIHRDLAARNCLVSDDHLVKVADFGLTRHVKLGDIYTAKVGAKFPIKWTAPEGLEFNKFTSKSDVWSFGVLLWEMATYGMAPYPGTEISEVFETLKTGHRMGRPSGCPDPVYQLMRQCWSWEPADRPTFWELHNQLQSLLLNPNIFDLIEQQEAIDKAHAEEEEQLMKLNNLLNCEQQRERELEQQQQQQQHHLDRSESVSLQNSAEVSEVGSLQLIQNTNDNQSSLGIQYPLTDQTLSMSQFDTKWAIEEFNRQQQLKEQQLQQEQQRSLNATSKNPSSINGNRQDNSGRLTARRKFAPTPPKRTSSCRETSYQDKKTADNDTTSNAHGSESTQYESGVSLSDIGECSVSTMDGLAKMFQTLNQGHYSRQEPALYDGNCNGLAFSSINNNSTQLAPKQKFCGDGKLVRSKSKLSNQPSVNNETNI